MIIAYIYGNVILGGDMMSIFNEARLETWNELKGLSDEKLNQKPSAEE